MHVFIHLDHGRIFYGPVSDNVLFHDNFDSYRFYGAWFNSLSSILYCHRSNVTKEEEEEEEEEE